jgi:hypothetical protein
LSSDSRRNPQQHARANGTQYKWAVLLSLTFRKFRLTDGASDIKMLNKYSGLEFDEARLTVTITDHHRFTFCQATVESDAWHTTN